MNITIIGGSGFIGTRLLECGHTVKIANKNDSKKYPQFRVYADVCKPDTLESILPGSDIVINLAAEHKDDTTPKSLYDDVKVTGANNVCNICTKLSIKNNFYQLGDVYFT